MANINDTRSPLALRYAAYEQALEAIAPQDCFADYDWGALPSPLSAAWLIYSQMVEEYSREIANSINRLIRHARRLKAWDRAIQGLSSPETLEVMDEFVDPVATLALNLPNVIRERFVFASAHLCHQANRAFDAATWSDDLPPDREIKLKVAARYGKRWSQFDVFMDAVKAIADEGHEQATNEFRNRYNHRFPARIGIGLTGLISRQHDAKTKRVSYGLGGAEAFGLDEVAALLDTQVPRCLAAFDAFKALVREHEETIRKWEAKQVAP